MTAGPYQNTFVKADILKNISLVKICDYRLIQTSRYLAKGLPDDKLPLTEFICSCICMYITIFNNDYKQSMQYFKQLYYKCIYTYIKYISEYKCKLINQLQIAERRGYLINHFSTHISC